MERITKPLLTKALKDLGLTLGDTVLVHSDLRLFGKPEHCESREEILRFYLSAIQEIIGTEGTLAVPAYFYEYARYGIPFDVDSSPVSLSLGSFSSYICRLPGRIRSCNPLQSIASIGGRAQELSGSLSLSGYGVCSPWHHLRMMGGKMLFLGVSMQPMTYVHYIEQQYGVPHLYLKIYPQTVIKNGKPLIGNPVSAVRYLDYGIEYDISPFEQILKSSEKALFTTIGKGMLSLVDASIAYDEGIRQLDKNIFFFLKKPPDFIPGRIPFDGITGAQKS
jgi:aminoglycoside 3-N-acetyltransferase